MIILLILGFFHAQGLISVEQIGLLEVYINVYCADFIHLLCYQAQDSVIRELREIHPKAITSLLPSDRS